MLLRPFFGAPPISSSSSQRVLAALGREPALAFPAAGGSAGRSASASGTDAHDRGDRLIDTITFGFEVGKYAMDVQGRGFLLR